MIVFVRFSRRQLAAPSSPAGIEAGDRAGSVSDWDPSIHVASEALRGRPLPPSPACACSSDVGHGHPLMTPVPSMRARTTARPKQAGHVLVEAHRTRAPRPRREATLKRPYESGGQVVDLGLDERQVGAPLGGGKVRRRHDRFAARYGKKVSPVGGMPPLSVNQSAWPLLAPHRLGTSLQRLHLRLPGQSQTIGDPFQRCLKKFVKHCFHLCCIPDE